MVTVSILLYTNTFSIVGTTIRNVYVGIPGIGENLSFYSCFSLCFFHFLQELGLSEFNIISWRYPVGRFWAISGHKSSSFQLYLSVSMRIFLSRTTSFSNSFFLFRSFVLLYKNSGHQFDLYFHWPCCRIFKKWSCIEASRRY